MSRDGEMLTAGYTIKVDVYAAINPVRLWTRLSTGPGDSPYGLLRVKCPKVLMVAGHREISAHIVVWWGPSLLLGR